MNAKNNYASWLWMPQVEQRRSNKTKIILQGQSYELWKGCPNIFIRLVTFSPRPKKQKPHLHQSLTIFLPHLPSLGPHIHQTNQDNFNEIKGAQPIDNLFDLKQHWKPNPRCSHIDMNTNSKTIINGHNFITWDCYELGRINGLESGLLELHEYEFNKCPTITIKPMHRWVVWDI